MKKLFLVCSLMASGCVADSVVAPSNASISFLPEAIEIASNSSFLNTDMTGRLILFNVLVSVQSERWTESHPGIWVVWYET